MQDNITRCTGLVRQYNPLNVAPGSLVKADNCVVRRENIVEDRRGYAVYSTLSNNAAQLLNYSGKVLAHNGTKISYDDGLGSFADYSGSYSAPSGSRIRAVESNSNLYFTTSTGVKVFTDAVGTAARSAGAPRALDPSFVLAGSPGTLLAADEQVAYKACIQRTDANGNVLYGFPSQRTWVLNSAGAARNVTLTMYLTSDITTSDVIQFYRTAIVTASPVSDDISGDEYQLVYQTNPSGTDITNGYVSFTDVLVDALRGAALYTNESQEGALQGNDEPPLCQDMALFKNQYMFYANTATKQRLFTSLLTSVVGLNTKTLTIAGVTYTANTTAENISTRNFKVYTSGVTATDIEDTARSLVRVVNRNTSNTSIYAYYTSSTDQVPGQIMFESRSVGAAAFTIQGGDATIGAAFFPNCTSINVATTSTNDEQPNALFYSKQQQVEAVPALNNFLVGPANDAILRIAALRNSLIIIKEKGVYRLTGETPSSFVVTPLDLTVFCKSAESVVVLANQVFMLTNQGVVAITDNGVQVVSREIEPYFNPLLTYSNISSKCFALGYESERQYMISVPTTTADTTATQMFVYNIFTRCWTRWTFAMSAGIIESVTDKMYFSYPSSAVVYKEKKTFDDADYSDPENDITITAISGSTVTFTSSVTPRAGWVISQASTGIAIDSISSPSGYYIATMSGDVPSGWSTGTAKLYPSVGFDAEWSVWVASNVSALKQVRSVQVAADPITGNSTASGITIGFKTNFDEIEDTVDVESSSYGWGGGPWGEFSWGGSGGIGFPTFVPRNKQYCNMMMISVKHNRANEKVSVAAIGFTYNMSAETAGR